MANQVQILSTKILSPLHKQELTKAGLEIIEADFIKTENKPFELKNLNESLIFTSQNAVHSVLSNPKSEELKSKNVYCVGLKTKKARSDASLFFSSEEGLFSYYYKFNFCLYFSVKINISCKFTGTFYRNCNRDFLSVDFKALSSQSI